MDIDTYTYFLIILAGFGLVWGYRKGNGSRKTISDFEYLGFSAFWGVIVVAAYQEMNKSNPEKFNELVNNPYAAGVVLFMIGVLAGFLVGAIFSSLKHKLNL